MTRHSAAIIIERQSNKEVNREQSNGISVGTLRSTENRYATAINEAARCFPTDRPFPSVLTSPSLLHRPPARETVDAQTRHVITYAPLDAELRAAGVISVGVPPLL